MSTVDEEDEEEDEDDEAEDEAEEAEEAATLPTGGAGDALAWNACVVRWAQTCGRLNAARNDLLTSWHLLAARAGA